jgi:ferredoxin
MENLITLSIIDRNGVEHSIQAPTDMNLNLMELAKMEGHGVKGECGGMALCATCQVYIESDHALPEQSDAELDMLDQAFFVQDNSRLGCQIYLRPELDGLKVRIAPEQD